MFSCHQYGPFHIPEDALVGTTVTAVLARDADVRGGDSWQVDYRLESGDEEDVFSLVTDKQTNEVTLVLSKVNNTKYTEALHSYIWLPRSAKNMIQGPSVWMKLLFFYFSVLRGETIQRSFPLRDTDINAKDNFWHSCLYLSLQHVHVLRDYSLTVTEN